MAGTGPAPKSAATRRTRHKPQRGDWKAAPGVGWQHGPVPDPLFPVKPSIREVWDIWMKSWYAAHWTVDDLPGLTVAIQTYEQCQDAFEDPFIEQTTAKGDTVYVLRPNPRTDLWRALDTYGITPKGQQDRRWARPVEPEKSTATKSGTPYRHLSVVG